MAMKGRQDWETGFLELHPNHKVGGKQQKIVYDMKQGREKDLDMETSVDEWSTSNCSSSEEDACSLEVLGIVLQDPEGEGSQDSLNKEEVTGLEEMLAKDLLEEDRGPYLQAVIANGPFEKWGIDAMGPLPRTANGKLYILVAIDYMTRFGTPLEIVSDNGPGFRRGLLTEVCEELKISHRHSTPYYPQSNGLVEKANGIIARIIRKMVESKPKRWDNFLDGAIWAYRTTYRDATQFTPFHLVYGQEALQPIELNIPTIKLTGRQEQSNDEAWIDRLLNLVELEWKREAAYHCYEKKALQLKDKLNEGIKDKQIKEKSLVLRYNNALDNRFDAKFERRWKGPFIVKKAFTGAYYQLMDLNGKEHPRKVNGCRLKPYLSRILPAVFETKQVSKKTKKDDYLNTSQKQEEKGNDYETANESMPDSVSQESLGIVDESRELVATVDKSQEELATNIGKPSPELDFLGHMAKNCPVHVHASPAVPIANFRVLPTPELLAVESKRGQAPARGMYTLLDPSEAPQVTVATLGDVRMLTHPRETAG
ncbi:hypothetical protein L7F22_067505 [Adiantum nelumboides]|nr:hypothetical protein [Adiantum nelumboides]